MKQLNKIRLMSGLPIDPTIEITEKKEVVTEARSVPKRKSELAAKDSKSLAKGVAGVKSAVKHVEQAIKALDKIPATDYAGNVPRFIQELEDLLTDSDGMKAHVRSCEDGAAAHEEEEVAKRRAEDEEATIKEDEVIDDAESDDDVIDEAMNFYTDMPTSWEEDEEKPINVSDGSSNDEQVWDEPRANKNNKNENPEQLRTGDEQSDQDQSAGLDIEADMKIPTAIMSQLTAAIKDATAESEKMSVSNKDASYFYKDLAKAFQDLKDHLDKGTRYDFKLAQSFAQSLMGPMIHKLPTDVWKFLTNGGPTRSLKDYMKSVKDPITGPRNTIK